MELNRCKNGHYYDPTKHKTCPYCPIEIEVDHREIRIELKDKDNEIFETQARFQDTNKPEPAKIDNAEEPGKTEDHSNVSNRRQQNGKTVSPMDVKSGIDPVVGWLACIEGPERGEDYHLHAEKNFIGRSTDMDVSIVNDPSIARESHAIVSFDPKHRSFKIYPGESRGLVYLNQNEVDTPKELKPYDIIELGQTKLIFVPLCGENFEWK